MRWLVDGYNVIRRDPELQAREAESLEAGRRALLHLLARAHRAPQDEFIVVFDGARLSGGALTGGRIRVVFSRPPLTADDELMRLARQMRSGAVVVSSDRKIQDAGRRSGSAVLTAEQFLEALEVPGRSADADTKDDSDEEPPREKRGNPRRLSKKARKAQRALGRLRQP
ncbi:MAG TPA: NYN domain-containing protein [Methylomirabilota bacterium]|jgi:predicted RNA-binding protein with PIN domain